MIDATPDAEAGRASRQPASGLPAAHLYAAGTGALGRTYSGPTVQPARARQTATPNPRIIGTRAAGPGLYAGPGKVILDRRRSARISTSSQ